MQVLTGEEIGGDSIIRDSALDQGRDDARGADYTHLRIAPKAPQDAPSDGLGVGAPPEKRRDLECRKATGDPLPREDAAALSRIREGRATAYRAQSEALRHHSDLLLAIWDPDTIGKPGGTLESVLAALSERIPVVAIRVGRQSADGTATAAEISVLEHVHDLRILEGRAGSRSEDRSDWKGRLKTLVERLVQFPDHPAKASDGHGKGTDALTEYRPRIAFAAYREDFLRPIWTARLWRFFDALVRLRVAQAAYREETDAEKRRDIWNTIVEARSGLMPKCLRTERSTRIPQEEKKETPFDRVYGAARKRAASSGMSGIFGDAHRGGILASSLLAPTAVLLAVTASILHQLGAPTGLQGLVAAAEVAAIVVMFALSVVSRSEGWSVAYADSRILAEALRMMEFLGPLGVHTPLPRLPQHLRGANRSERPDSTWAMWYFRALVRMAPLRLESEGERPNLEDLRRRLRTRAVHLQREYHRRNELRQKRIHDDVEQTSLRLFGVILLCAAVHLVDVTVGPHWPLLAMGTLLVCAVGPAVIAAMHSLVAQLEAERLHQRSESMVQLLEQRAEVLASLDLDTSPASAEAVWGLASEALTTASLLMEETADWSLLYRNAGIPLG